MIRIIVTGGMGFIGSHFVNKLNSEINNCEITVIDKLTYASNPNNINTQVKFIKEESIFDQIDVKSLALFREMMADRYRSLHDVDL